MISLEEAQARLLDRVEPLEVQSVSLSGACGRFLAQDLIARLTQPPFPAASMDGYAIRFADPVDGPVVLGAGRFVGLGLCLPIGRGVDDADR